MSLKYEPSSEPQAAPALAAAGTPMLLTHMGEVEDAFAKLPVPFSSLLL